MATDMTAEKYFYDRYPQKRYELVKLKKVFAQLRYGKNKPATNKGYREFLYLERTYGQQFMTELERLLAYV